MNVTEPAFPRIGVETDLTGDGSGQKFPHVYSYQEAAGLTKRELLAAMAMQGLLSNLEAIRREGFKDAEIEEFAVMRADALLEKLRA